MIRRLRALVPSLAAVSAFAAGNGDDPEARHREPEPSLLREQMMQQKWADRLPVMNLAPIGPTPCIAGAAAGFPCREVDLEALLPSADIGGGYILDIWGWTDPLNGREYAIVTRSNGTAFVDLGDPQRPIYLGNLPTHTISASWRDAEVYADHAFIVADYADDHGVQVFDLTTLRSVAAPPVTFTETAHYAGLRRSHTLAINTDSGFAYALGSNTCGGGPHMIDVRNPRSPLFAGCIAADGYTHDAQCVTYTGPDADHRGREVCFNANEDTLTLFDVTDKAAPLLLSRTGYPGNAYAHQGWLDDRQSYLFMDDEWDEFLRGLNTSTHIWDVRDLDAPRHLGAFRGETTAIDHNLYVKGSLIFASNYRAGLRIYDMCCDGASSIAEVGYFDVYPADDLPTFNGSWSNYPYFASGIVIAGGIEQGLFVLRPRMTGKPGSCVELGAGDPLPDVTNALRATRAGDDVVLRVLAVPPADGGFTLHRSEVRRFQGDILAPPISTTTDRYADVGVVLDMKLYFYEARAVDGCGIGSP